MSKATRVSTALLAFVLLAAVSARADVTPRWSDADLARFSDAIVTGRVVDIASGRDPATGAIYSYVTLSVDQVIKGSIAEREITIKQLGGQIGDEGLAVANQAVFTRGEDVLLFLETRPRDRTLYTAALWQGKWNLQRDAATGERIAVRAQPQRSDRGILAGEGERRALQAFMSRVGALQSPGAGTRGFVVSPSAGEMKAASHQNGVGGAPFALFSPPWRWNEFDSGASIPVDVMAGGQPGLAGGGINELIRLAGEWSGATGLRFVGAGNTPGCSDNAATGNGHILIGFMDPCGEVSDSGGTLAFGGAYYTSSGGRSVSGIAFNRAVSGFIVNNNSATALQFLQNSPCFGSVDSHELGHVLGLDHSADPTALMYPSLSFSRCSLGPVPLSADDLQGIRVIYPGTTSTVTLPGPPIGLTASSSGSSVTLAWLAPPSGGTPSAYFIEAGSVPGAANLAAFSTGNAATTFSASGVGSGVYYVRVKASNSAGVGGPSNEATLVVGSACGGAPGAPSGFVLTGNSGGTVSFQWIAAAGGPTSYIIEAGSTPGATNLANSDLGSTATSFTASGVGRGTYFVRLRARNACGTGAPSNEVTLVVPFRAARPLAGFV
jgi:hypothetical protein